MIRSLICATTACALLAFTAPAQASIGCSVVSGDKGAQSVSMYANPEDTAQNLHDIPLGDIVLYPQADLAPAKADGWVWVRHDINQTDIWQSGTYGWLKAENITDCG
ncbi:hypothetical protein [Pseudosulfitobacter sp. DSM 107133]|uniref:hypothetical protein n=1 Tax=Pseudosulfitobacter sp. DSM 107133 TaxID=2883100 RepID=UPI000DF266F3|nr:hypothetical protein [Pseudosulfitobacter sp. DSM 107133]UOA26683.1 hypothetical protein DSM107133_01385 [Pseudosulfitobacter sp. DSM 107133]